MGEPQFHSGITDVLPADHPQAYTTLYCVTCGQQLHASNNECMQPWFETNSGPYCVPDWLAAYDLDEPDGDQKLGLGATEGVA